MSLADQIRSEFESYKNDVNTKVDGLQEHVQALQSQIDSMEPGEETEKLQASLDAIKAAHTSLLNNNE